MDKTTGFIRDKDDFPEEKRGSLQNVDLDRMSPAQRKRLLRDGVLRVGRNHPCPCGSGKKFKKCCLEK